MVFWLLGVLALLAFFAVLSFSMRGEVLQSLQGEVQTCEILGEETPDSLVHATIRAENGSYLIADLDECRPGMLVRVVVKRGALFFNTVYGAER
ncbi:MAG: hypothetical protein AAGA91_15000 [Pseudomonadota bacterium]